MARVNLLILDELVFVPFSKIWGEAPVNKGLSQVNTASLSKVLGQGYEYLIKKTFLSPT